MSKTLTRKSLRKQMEQKTADEAEAAEKMQAVAQKRLSDSLALQLSELTTTLAVIQSELDSMHQSQRQHSRKTWRKRWTPALVAGLVSAATCGTLWAWMLWQQAETQQIASRTAIETIRRIGTVEKDNQGREWLKIPLATPSTGRK